MPIGEHTAYMEAVLWTLGRGVIVGDSALALWELADVNPRKIRVQVPRGYAPRKRDGERYTVTTGQLDADDVDEIDGIPVAKRSSHKESHGGAKAAARIARRSGTVTRSGSLTTSVKAMPFGQANPADSGCCLSGRSAVSRPSSTVAIMPHSGSQIRQNVTLCSTFAASVGAIGSHFLVARHPPLDTLL